MNNGKTREELAEEHVNPHGILVDKASQAFRNKHRAETATYLAGFDACLEQMKLTDEEQEKVQKARQLLGYPNYIPMLPSCLAIIDRLTSQGAK